MRVRAKFQGRERVMKRLRKLVPDAEKEAAKEQEASAKELAVAIQARAPRKTGEYAASINAGLIAGRNDGQQPIGIQATKDPNAWGIFALYIWRFLEFGARSHSLHKGANLSSGKHQDNGPYTATPAQPHIFPTYRAMRKRIRRKVAGGINRAIKKFKQGR